MCYDQQQLDQVYGTSEARDGNVKLCWGFRKPTSVSAKKSGTDVSILQLLISLTMSNFEYCTNCTKLFSISFPGKIVGRIWDNSLCGILSSTVTVTPIYLEQWAPALGNLEMQPLRWNTRCNVNSSDPQEMPSSGGCLLATESVFGHIGGNRAQLDCSPQKVLQKHNF